MRTYIHDGRHKAEMQWVNIFELWPIRLNDFELEKEIKYTIRPYIFKSFRYRIIAALVIIFVYRYIQVNKARVVNAVNK